MGAANCPAQCTRTEGESPSECAGGLAIGVRGCNKIETISDVVPCCSKTLGPPRTRSGRFSTSLARKWEASARRNSTIEIGEEAGIDHKARRLSAGQKRQSGTYSWLRAEVREFESNSVEQNFGDFGRKGDRETFDMFMEVVRSGTFQETVDMVEKYWSVVLRFKDARGRNALMIAATTPMRNAPEKLDFLLHAGMDLEAEDVSGWTALLHAARCGNVETAEFLIKAAADVNATTQDRKSPLMLAAIDGADQLVVDLVKAKASLHHRDKKDWTTLFYACEYDRPEMVRWLIKIDMDPNRRTKDGVTLLMTCAEAGSLRMAKALSKWGMDVNGVDVRGNSALMIALKHKHEEFASFLLDRECDVALTNDEGRTAIHIAREANMHVIAARMQRIERQLQDEVKRGEDHG